MIQPPAPPTPQAIAKLRARRDGWTPERQQRFLVALAGSRSITGAAAAVGMSVRSAYKLRRHPAAAGFRAAWDAALVRPVPAQAPALTTMERAMARETVVRSGCSRGGGFGSRLGSGLGSGGGPVTIDRPIPAGRLIRQLARFEAKLLAAQKRAISSTS